MISSKRPLRTTVDAGNPGQFFACCGLAETAGRLWLGLECWFDPGFFVMDAGDRDVLSLTGLATALIEAPLEQLEPSNQTASPLALGPPFNLRLDWWAGDEPGSKDLKTWAGRMNGTRIARAMRAALPLAVAHAPATFDFADIIFDPDEPDSKVEPFYFDARRGGSARPLDLAFSPDALDMRSKAFPAVEFFCLVGLQRCRPTAVDRRVFDYQTWHVPLGLEVLPAAVQGFLPYMSGEKYRFESAFRTDQRKHKAFTPATPGGAVQ